MVFFFPIFYFFRTNKRNGFIECEQQSAKRFKNIFFNQKTTINNFFLKTINNMVEIFLQFEVCSSIF